MSEKRILYMLQKNKFQRYEEIASKEKHEFFRRGKNLVGKRVYLW